jgi:hypothetical protein
VRCKWCRATTPTLIARDTGGEGLCKTCYENSLKLSPKQIATRDKAAEKYGELDRSGEPPADSKIREPQSIEYAPDHIGADTARRLAEGRVFLYSPLFPGDWVLYENEEWLVQAQSGCLYTCHRPNEPRFMTAPRDALLFLPRLTDLLQEIEIIGGANVYGATPQIFLFLDGLRHCRMVDSVCHVLREGIGKTREEAAAECLIRMLGKGLPNDR